MPDTFSDISIEYEEDGVQVIKELDREVISKGGAWVTILFRYQQWDPKAEKFGEDQYSLRRYRKIAGEYRQQNRFNISGASQARKIVETLQKWIP